MGVEWIEHKGKRILLCDYRGMSVQDVIENMELEAKKILEEPQSTKVRILDDFEDATIDSAVMARLKELGEVVEPRTEKAAILGIRGIRHILLAAYNRVTGASKHQKLFDNREETLDWLASD